MRFKNSHFEKDPFLKTFVEKLSFIDIRKKSKLGIEGCAFQLFRKEKLVIAEISLRLITFFYLSFFISHFISHFFR